jgi:hypothetical protein
MFVKNGIILAQLPDFGIVTGLTLRYNVCTDLLKWLLIVFMTVFSCKISISATHGSLVMILNALFWKNYVL